VPGDLAGLADHQRLAGSPPGWALASGWAGCWIGCGRVSARTGWVGREDAAEPPRGYPARRKAAVAGRDRGVWALGG
jgi:hypothetical protein